MYTAAITVGAKPEGIVYVPGRRPLVHGGGRQCDRPDRSRDRPVLGRLRRADGQCGAQSMGTYDPAPTALIYFTEGLAGKIGSFNPATITSPAGITE